MNALVNAVFFVVISGTQAPVGFTEESAACIYSDATRGAALFAWFKPGGEPFSCDASFDNGCERAEKERQKYGVPMVEARCAWREEKKRVVVPK